MADRMGTCAECNARYKIPATFKGTRAKCKKCGGIVEIPPIEEEAAQAGKPKAAPAGAAGAGAADISMKGAKAGSVRTKARPRRGKASSARRSSARSRRGGGDEDEGGTPSWVWIIAGVSLVGIVIILAVLMSGDDDKVPTTDLASADTIEETTQEPVEKIQPEETAPVEPEPLPETTTPPPTEIAEDPADVDPIIQLDPLPAIIGCDQETFDRLFHCFEHGFIKQELPPWKRKPLKTEFDKAGFERTPILLNAFNGLDLLNADNVVVAFRIAEMWNKMTGKGWVDVPIKGDTSPEEMEANLSWNSKGIYSIYGIWAKKVGDQEAQRKFFVKCEEKVRKAAAREAAEDE